MDAFNDFLGYRELTRLPSKTIVEFFTNLDDIDSLVESLYSLSEQEILLNANLTIAHKMDSILDHIEGITSKRFDDESDNLHLYRSTKVSEPLDLSEESKILVSKLRERLDAVFSMSEYDRQCAEMTYVSTESMKRKLPKGCFSSFFSPSFSEISVFADRDYDVLNLILNRPDLLGAMDAKYVLSTINKIVSDYPDTFKDDLFRNNVLNYLAYPGSAVCKKGERFKIDLMFIQTYNNVENLLDVRKEKKLTSK
jgi:hypothetical protein